MKLGALLVLALAVALVPAVSAGADDRSLREMSRSLRQFDAALVWDGRGVRRYMSGRRGAADQAWRRAGRHFDRSVRLTNRAIRAIRG